MFIVNKNPHPSCDILECDGALSLYSPDDLGHEDIGHFLNTPFLSLRYYPIDDLLDCGVI